NYVLLWSTSPLRDVPAHLFAMSGLLLVLPGGRRLGVGWREALPGFLLGCAITTRVDAVLYLLPAASLALLRRTALLRRALLGACGLALGVAPLRAYNALATGNPFRPTQAMEVNSVLSSVPGGASWWRALTPFAVRAVAADDVPTSAATPAAADPADALPN